MKVRSTFRRRTNPAKPRFVFYSRDWQRHFEAIRDIGRNAPKNLPGETNRQLAARLRAAATETPTKPKRTKKVAA